jgi:sterol desaturase/sphingolipid hydroxylase (fatty acid hydroxylase superfamily)
MRESPKPVRLFDSDLLERFSRVHPLVPLLLWTPVVAWFLWRSLAVQKLGIGDVAVAGAAGLLAWTLTEYLVHRFVFHAQATTPGRRRLQFIVHGVHHAVPDDPRRLLMPPVPAILATAVLYVLFRTVLGPVWSEPFFAFFLVGYLGYDYIHLSLHHGGLPTRIGRYLRRQHMLHHHATPDARWGVSSPLWDHVFGTTGARSRPSDPPLKSLARRGAASLLIVGALMAMAPSLGATEQEAEWQALSNQDGILIERRFHQGFRVYEVRATTWSPLPPAAIFETVWKQREHREFVPYLKRLDLLSESGDERVTYEQVAVPLARDRDYTVRLHKHVDQGIQRYEILFASANDAGPPPDGSHVRVAQIRGRWLIEPGSQNKGAKVKYEVLSEPGGSIPTWLINRVQGEAAARLVRAMLQRTLDKNK